MQAMTTSSNTPLTSQNMVSQGPITSIPLSNTQNINITSSTTIPNPAPPPPPLTFTTSSQYDAALQAAFQRGYQQVQKQKAVQQATQATQASQAAQVALQVQQAQQAQRLL